jgi:hypothetical protein
MRPDILLIEYASKFLLFRGIVPEKVVSLPCLVPSPYVGGVVSVPSLM